MDDDRSGRTGVRSIYGIEKNGPELSRLHLAIDARLSTLVAHLGWRFFGAWRNTWISSNSGILDDSIRDGSFII